MILHKLNVREGDVIYRSDNRKRKNPITVEKIMKSRSYHVAKLKPKYYDDRYLVPYAFNWLGCIHFKA